MNQSFVMDDNNTFTSVFEVNRGRSVAQNRYKNSPLTNGRKPHNFDPNLGPSAFHTTQSNQTAKLKTALQNKNTVKLSPFKQANSVPFKADQSLNTQADPNLDSIHQDMGTEHTDHEMSIEEPSLMEKSRLRGVKTPDFQAALFGMNDNEEHIANDVQSRQIYQFVDNYYNVVEEEYLDSNNSILNHLQRANLMR